MIKFIGKIFYLLTRIYQFTLRIYKSSIVNWKGGRGKGRISHRVDLGNPYNIYIGKNTYINGGELHAGKQSKIIIGENCLISYDVHIRAIKHNYIDSNTLIIEQGESEEDVIIGNDVWIGKGVFIGAGIKIGKGAVIGAGSIVTKNVKEYEVVGGNPAKVIKHRI